MSTCRGYQLYGSLTFIHNWALGGCMPHTWNLGVQVWEKFIPYFCMQSCPNLPSCRYPLSPSRTSQVQFYLALPLLLLVLHPAHPGLRRRVAMSSVVLVVLGLVYRYWAVIHFNIQVFMGMDVRKVPLPEST